MNFLLCLYQGFELIDVFIFFHQGEHQTAHLTFITLIVQHGLILTICNSAQNSLTASIIPMP